jgi:hypothetical protein
MQLAIFQDEAREAEATVPIDHRAERNFARAAEFLVAYDISRRGWDCYPVGEGLRYDLIADIGGLRRVQVKMNRRARCMKAEPQAQHRPGYLFGKGEGDLRDYSKDVDLFAFVAMDRRLILYISSFTITRAHLWVTGSFMTVERCDLSWTQAI